MYELVARPVRKLQFYVRPVLRPSFSDVSCRSGTSRTRLSTSLQAMAPSPEDLSLSNSVSPLLSSNSTTKQLRH